ncbi:MAG: hypothetical protein F6K14_08385 [Symploca sp. SIO2C1]|nr:hypothetical protein [Symploca sp. SIO2C1]
MKIKLHSHFLVAAVLAVVTTTTSNLRSPATAETVEEYKAECKNKTTIISSAEEVFPLFQWNNLPTDVNLNAQESCEYVAEKLQAYIETNGLQAWDFFINVKKDNNSSTMCIKHQSRDSCDHILLRFPGEVDQNKLDNLLGSILDISTNDKITRFRSLDITYYKVNLPYLIRSRLGLTN